MRSAAADYSRGANRAKALRKRARAALQNPKDFYAIPPKRGADRGVFSLAPDQRFCLLILAHDERSQATAAAMSAAYARGIGVDPSAISAATSRGEIVPLDSGVVLPLNQATSWVVATELARAAIAERFESPFMNLIPAESESPIS